MIKEYEIQRPTFEDEPPPLWKYAESHQCEHYFVIARGVQSNGVIMYKEMCCRCGEVRGGAIGHNKLTKEQKENATDYGARDELRIAYQESLKDKYRREFGVMPSDYLSYRFRERADFWLWYLDYLRSDVWSMRRQAVFRRAHGICEACGMAAATEVHHLTYNHVGREPLFELVAVCTECHEQITAWDRSNR